VENPRISLIQNSQSDKRSGCPISKKKVKATSIVRVWMASCPQNIGGQIVDFAGNALWLIVADATIF
jgi:hypothetical protein